MSSNRNYFGNPGAYGYRGRISDARINPKFVPESRHCIFIRGLPASIDSSKVREHFNQETNSKCTIDFTSFNDDHKRLSIAIRFETNEMAKEMLNKYNSKELFDYPVEVRWFKDLKKARNRLLDDRTDSYRPRGPIRQFSGDRRGGHRYSPQMRTGGAASGGVRAGMSRGDRSMSPPGNYHRGGGESSGGEESRNRRSDHMISGGGGGESSPGNDIPANYSSRGVPRRRSMDRSTGEGGGRGGGPSYGGGGDDGSYRDRELDDHDHARERRSISSVSHSLSNSMSEGSFPGHKPHAKRRGGDGGGGGTPRRSGSSSSSHASAFIRQINRRKMLDGAKKNGNNINSGTNNNSNAYASSRDVSVNGDDKFGGASGNAHHEKSELQKAPTLSGEHLHTSTADINDEMPEKNAASKNEIEDGLIAVTENNRRSSSIGDSDNNEVNENYDKIGKISTAKTNNDEDGAINDHEIGDKIENNLEDLTEKRKKRKKRKRRHLEQSGDDLNANRAFEKKLKSQENQFDSESEHGKDLEGKQNDEYPENMSEEQILSVIAKKKEEIERVYKKDCETYSSVFRLIISKDDNLEERLMPILKELLNDLGKKSIEKLRNFILSISGSTSETSALRNKEIQSDQYYPDRDKTSIMGHQYPLNDTIKIN